MIKCSMITGSMGITRDLHSSDGFMNAGVELSVVISGVYVPGEKETASDYGWTPASEPDIDDIIALLDGQTINLTPKEVRDATHILLQNYQEG